MSDFAKQVALAITRSSGTAGQAYDAEEPQGAEQRAENLTSPVGEYGPYIVEGDPYGWSEGALATILMEQKGSKGDCFVPLNYYGDGMTVSHLASSRIKGGYIEFVNAAVAVVHKA
jgi:hypothetical protein